MSFDTMLVANRGEIACRVLRTARALGYRTVAVYSDADADAPHVALADRAVRIGPAAVDQSYLDPARILAAADKTGAQAIHPGYGFLSENADFARQCAAAGLIFVGPPPDAIDAMGDKSAAKVRMRAAGVPCVPGFDGDDPSDQQLLEAASTVGFPLLVKASAGGGGRGMRRVDSHDGLATALTSARTEAANAFGSGHLLLERLVENARHVEVQVVADQHGAVIHLGERDCSVQRRHQKVIEEAPSPAVSPTLRNRMGDAACAAARAVGYVGAGTVEFLLENDGSFYFLEMNTRLQVEHPVTELVTGLDLVELQLQIAQGKPLPLAQDDVTLSGHAIEARLYAEEPAAGFAPRTGAIQVFEPATGPGLRVDAGVRSGSIVSADYDPMIAKFIAWGPDRATARRRLARALEDSVVLGLTHNRAFLARVLRHPVFAAGEVTTAFLDQHTDLAAEPALSAEATVIATAAHLLAGAPTGLVVAHRISQTVALDVGGHRVAAGLRRSGPQWYVEIDGIDHTASLTCAAGGAAQVRIDDQSSTVLLRRAAGATWVQVRGHAVRISPWDPSPAVADTVAGDGRVRAPSAGRVLKVQVEVGDAVQADTTVALVEAMKLETALVAGVVGSVVEIRVAAGDSVAADQVMLLIEPAPEAST